MADNTTVLPPLKAVTATDQGGILAITASLGLVFGVISLLIRTYVRIECRASFGKDDHVAFLSMFFALIQGILVFLAISRGFGEIVADLTPDAILAWQRDLYVSDIFFLIGMWLTKSSIALLLMRLSRDHSHSVMARVLLAASAVYFVVSLFVVSIRCDISQPWNDAVDGCSTSTYARWAAVTVLDILTEVALFVGGVWLVRGVQLPWSKKSVVVIAYGLRLPVILAAAVRLYYIHSSLYSDDESLHGILASVCTQIELSYAVIATTMPCLKPFMSALNTGYGGGATFVLSQTTPNSSALQRSRDTAGTTSSSSKAKAKVKAAAVAMMSGAAGGGGGSGNGTSGGAGSRSGSRARKSTESQTRILVVDDGAKSSQKDGGGSSSKDGTDSDGNLSRTATMTSSSVPPPMPRLAPSQTQYIPPPPKQKSGYNAVKTTSTSKSTTITATTISRSPFGGRSRMSAQSPTSEDDAAKEISVTQEKELEPMSPASPEATSPIIPASPSYAHYADGNGRERIGHAE
ncbi:hypothetical protein SCUCBS95973_000948 [Sporothrix curviconia]|uniref:Rhodopsin domain-containing protein n=1 Tax=Sporothrix curviconia TaxID=1260050 RepID=A0ABP0AUE5_9PEZI